MKHNVDESKIMQAYDNGTPEVQKALSGLFTDMSFVKPKALPPKAIISITDRVKTFEDACIVLGLDPNRENLRLGAIFITPANLDASGQDKSATTPLQAGGSIFSKDTAAYEKLKIIVAALNEGWKPDWSNASEYKYNPWFRVIPDASKPSGFGLSYDDCDRDSGYTIVGLLVFKTRALAEYACRIFVDLYNDYLL